jgi:hypothetical protein
MKKEPRTTLLYGETGSTKTTQLALLALDIYQKTGKTSRLVQCDGGGSKQFDDLGLIEAGIVDRFVMPATEHKIANLFRLSKGYWPKLKNDRWSLNHTEEYMTTPDEFSKLGAYIFDSITGMGEMLTEHVSEPSRNIGFKLGTNNTEDGYTFGTLDKGHFNIIQKELRKAFEFGFNSLPVDYFLASARVSKGESNNRTSTYGPATAGNAITSDVPSWFNDCYYLETKLITDGDDIYSAKVAWFEQHLDSHTQIPYPAKIRCLPVVYKQLKSEKLYPEGYTILYPEDGILSFLANLEALTKKAKKAANLVEISKVS